MVTRSEEDATPREARSPVDSALLRMAAYFILEPVAAPLALGLLLGGIGGNVGSFAFGVFVGHIASSILRQKYRDGRI